MIASHAEFSAGITYNLLRCHALILTEPSDESAVRSIHINSCPQNQDQPKSASSVSPITAYAVKMAGTM